MTDQPKPNQPTQPSPPAQAPSVPKEVAPAAEKAPTVPTSSAQPKPAEVKPDAAAKPATEAKPEPKPDALPVSVNSAPTKPTSTDGSAPPPAPQPPKPATTESAPQAAQPPKPTNSGSGESQETVPTKTVDAGSDKPKPVAAPPTAPVSSSAPTEKRDISEDPTIPGRPAPILGTTRPIGSPAPASESVSSLPPLPPAAPLAASSVPPASDKEDTIPPPSSGTKVTQRFTEPIPVGQTAGTICPSCGHRNRPGTLICDNCGTNLVGGAKSSVGTRDLVSATEAAPGNEPLMDASQLNAVESAGGSVFSEDMVLRIEIEGGATPMLVYPKQEIILGRRDPNTGTLPDVDMTAYSGYRMGVSRTHASIHLQDKQLNLSDRGSSNGTFLNGTRLVAHRPYPVKDGDEIRLGQMVLKIYFQSNKTRK